MPWLNPASVGCWLFAAPNGEMQRVEIDARAGGGFAMVEKHGEMLAEHFGTYVEIDRPQRLVFTFATDREQKPTRMTVEITPVAGGCELTLTHEMDPQWAGYADRARAGWTLILDGLAAAMPIKTG